MSFERVLRLVLDTDMYLHIPDEDRDMVRLATFGTLDSTGGNVQPTLSSARCFLQDNPSFPAEKIVRAIFEQFKINDGNVSYAGPDGSHFLAEHVFDGEGGAGGFKP